VRRLTGLAEVQLIAHPLRIAFRAVAGFELTGRGDAHGRRGLLLRGTPAHLGHPRDGTAIILELFLNKESGRLSSKKP
jgi:hypothetical protein